MKGKLENQREIRNLPKPYSSWYILLVARTLNTQITIKRQQNQAFLTFTFRSYKCVIKIQISNPFRGLIGGHLFEGWTLLRGRVLICECYI